VVGGEWVVGSAGGVLYGVDKAVGFVDVLRVLVNAATLHLRDPGAAVAGVVRCAWLAGMHGRDEILPRRSASLPPDSKSSRVRVVRLVVASQRPSNVCEC